METSRLLGISGIITIFILYAIAMIIFMAYGPGMSRSNKKTRRVMLKIEGIIMIVILIITALVLIVHYKYTPI